MNGPVVTKRTVVMYHQQEITHCRRDLAKENRPVERQRLLYKIEWHQAAVNCIQRADESADKRARQSCSAT